MDNKKKWPSIKDAKPATKTPVKYDKHMGTFVPHLPKAKRLSGQRKGYNV